MAENAKPWTTEDANVFQVDGRKFNVLKRGREQAVQIEKLNGWLKQHIAPLSQQLNGNQDAAMGWSLFSSVMGEMTADAQMDLARVLLGDKDIDGKPFETEFLEKNYDINWVIDALEIVNKNASVQRLITAFFTNLG